ncbi:MAG: hypothetical protein FWH08_01165 [Oscillospiraceae bacterium]|nr:hypothetical protein [Oscillospiraceae bacterium]
MLAKKCFKNLMKRDGAVLFTVLVTMTLLIMLASALFLTINSERGEIYETARSEQLYQTAVSVNDWVADFLISYTGTFSGVDPDDLEDDFINAMLDLGVGDSMTTAQMPVSAANPNIGNYKIIVSRLNDDGDDKIFEIETVVDNGLDVVRYARIMRFTEGSDFFTPPAIPGSGAAGDDDGFFNVPASYRGMRNIALYEPSFDGLHVVGRSYFGGHGVYNSTIGRNQPTGLISFDNIRVRQDMDVFDNAVFLSGAYFDAAIPVRLNFYGDFTLDGGMTSDATVGFMPNGGTIRVGGDFLSPKSISANNTVYVFGDMTITNDGLVGGPEGGATLYVAGDLTISNNAIGDNVTMYVNGTATIPSGAAVGSNVRLFVRQGSPVPSVPAGIDVSYVDPFPWAADLPTSTLGVGDGMIAQYLELQQSVGYYTYEGFREEMQACGTVHAQQLTGSECITWKYHDDDPGDITVHTYVGTDGKIRQLPVINPGAPAHVTTDFQAKWAPKWRPQTNPSTEGHQKNHETNFYEPHSVYTPSGNDNRIKMQTNHIELALVTKPGLQQPHPTLDRTLVITDSGYITAPIATGNFPNASSSPVSTIIVDTTKGNADPHLHENIFIVLNTQNPFVSSARNVFTESNAENEASFLNILVKGAGNVIFVMNNETITTAAQHYDLGSPVGTGTGDSNFLINDTTGGYGQTSNLFVGHMGWVDEFNLWRLSQGLTEVNYDENLALSFRNSTDFMGIPSGGGGILSGGEIRNLIHPLYDCYNPSEIGSNAAAIAANAAVAEAKDEENRTAADWEAIRVNGLLELGVQLDTEILPHKATCEYCRPENKPEGASGKDYSDFFGRHALRQDGGVNVVTDFSRRSADGRYIHNNIFFVNDDDGGLLHANFYGISNVIFGYTYAPGSRTSFSINFADAPFGRTVIDDPPSQYSIAAGGYIYGDFSMNPNYIGQKIQVVHIMPLDYYRNTDLNGVPTGRTTRGVVHAMVGEAFKGMSFWSNQPIQPPGYEIKMPGRFSTVGFR